MKLLIESLYDVVGGDYLAAYSKGHHDLAAFAAAVASEQGIAINEVPEPQLDWWRWIRGVQAPGVAGQRGSFPVTVVWF